MLERLRTFASGGRLSYRGLRALRLAAVAIVLVGHWVAPARAATGGGGRWTFRATALFVSPDGEFSAVRANGKRVTSDIDSSPGLRLGAEYRAGERLGWSLGYLRSGHDFAVHQDFPDGTDFESGDGFAADLLTAGVVVHLTPRRRSDLFVEALVSWATYDDVSLASAGPPFDRDAPFLEVDMQDTFGAGVLLGVERPIGSSSWAFHASAGVFVLPFEGEFPTQPDEPGEASTSTLDPGFDPVVLGIGLSYGGRRRSAGR